MDPLTLSTAIVAALTPFLPVLLEGGKKLASTLGEKAGQFSAEQASAIWKKLQGNKPEDKAVQSVAQSIAVLPDNPDLQKTLASLLAAKLAKEPDLAQELTQLLGGEKAVLEVLASGGSTVENVEQHLTGPGVMKVEAKENSLIKGVIQKKS